MLKRNVKAARAGLISASDYEPPLHDKNGRCLHLTGYWINEATRNFRCYECQCQFHIGDNLPANHPTGGIETWEDNWRAR